MTYVLGLLALNRSDLVISNNNDTNADNALVKGQLIGAKQIG